AEAEARGGGRLDQSVEDQAAEHRTAVVAEDHQDRLALPEQRGKANAPSGLVRKLQAGGNLVAQVLDDVDILKRGQRLLAPGRERQGRLLGARWAGEGEACEKREAKGRRPGAGFRHHRGAPMGCAPEAAASIARSIGTWAIPLALSTQP